MLVNILVCLYVLVTLTVTALAGSWVLFGLAVLLAGFVVWGIIRSWPMIPIIAVVVLGLVLLCGTAFAFPRAYVQITGWWEASAYTQCSGTNCQAPPVQPQPTAQPTMPAGNTACEDWIGDCFGPEMALPAVVQGPAIVELWDGSSYCAIVAIHEGETLDWTAVGYAGAFWEADSEAALVARFPHHSMEYLNKDNSCLVLQSADQVDPTP